MKPKVSEVIESVILSTGKNRALTKEEFLDKITNALLKEEDEYAEHNATLE